MTHQELVASLSEHLWQPTRLVWVGTALGSRWLQGGSCPIPDVLTMQKSYTTPMLTVYEVKASRSDFRSDVTTGKWLRYKEICSRVLFASPAGLIKAEELPAGAGLIVYSADRKSWAVRRKGDVGKEDLSEMEWQSLLFAQQYAGREQRDLRYRRLGVDLADLEESARRHGARLAQVVARIKEERVEHALLATLRQHYGCLPSGWDVAHDLQTPFPREIYSAIDRAAGALAIARNLIEKTSNTKEAGR